MNQIRYLVTSHGRAASLHSLPPVLVHCKDGYLLNGRPWGVPTMRYYLLADAYQDIATEAPRGEIHQMPADNETRFKCTPARINVGRAGTRPRTATWLAFRADHARARDAVHSELSESFISRLASERGCQLIQSDCSDRADFILFPPKGKCTSPQALAQLKLSCISGSDVQIIISDGLSAQAVEANVPDLLPILEDGLKMEKLSSGTPVIVRLGRVAIGDQIAHCLGARLVINLIGERPGLSSSESLSAYITLNPGPQTISSDRTVVSNIHRVGTPALEAGAYIVQLVKKIFKLNLSGVKLQQADG